MASHPPPTSRQLTTELVALYVLAEQTLLERSTAILQRTVATVLGQATAVAAVRRLVRSILEQLTLRTDALVVAMVNASAAEGHRDGELLALRELERFTGSGSGGAGRPPGSSLELPDDDPFDLSMPHGERAAQAIRDDLISELEDVRHRITRLPDDIHKAIAPHGSIYQVLDNDVTPAQAQAMAWRVFVSQGITGFTDRSGRNWSLSAYTEMAVRTAATRAYNASHLARMKALGINYFTIPRHLGSCPKCFPWQGAVLTDGPVTDPVIPVDATLAEAVIAGLFHPNCEHTLLPVIPGVTDLGVREKWDADKQAAYDLTQTQRRFELAVRKAKRQLEYAITPEARAEAARDVRRAQKRVREFVLAHGLARQSRREQIDLANPTMKVPGARASTPPPAPPRPPMPPATPDPSDRDAWRAYWKARQDALRLDFGTDRLEPHEIEFHENFRAAGQVIIPIRRSRNAQPSADFTWVNRGIDVELKTPLSSATYTRIARRIRNAVKAATVAGVSKPNFMIDLRSEPLTAGLRASLAAYNLDNPGKAIERLFVFHMGVVEEIVLRT